METIIQKALKLLLDKYGAPYDCVTVVEENSHYRASIETPDPARLIGRNGTLLNALQIILKNILWKQNEEKAFVTLDVDGYRQDQYERIYQKVESSIDMMKERNLSEIKLNPMKPFLRRLVHLWVAENYPELTTDSVGEGRQRAVRIHYK
ncbi:KH domain-containing protein [Candidatus Gracilibacteria bacterium]|nr:KH domain-containing protein [Candidatus Gracilibacteria bacterium]MCF7819135.1 KH domain-containing protein [Candidatus Gracilibacteria bacterium]